MVSEGRAPLDILEETVGDEVMIHLKGSKIFEGVLVGYDQHMNLVIDGDNVSIIRGDNVESVIPRNET